MSNLARIEPDLCGEENADQNQLYVAYILKAMDEQDISLRSLSLRCQIGRSRLGRILHRNVPERLPITLYELMAILRALQIDFMQAVISVETVRDLDVMGDCRIEALVAMLSAMFKQLPIQMIAALEEIHGCDGSEIRTEWAPHLQTLVVRRFMEGVQGILRRREELAEQIELRA